MFLSQDPCKPFFYIKVHLYYTCLYLPWSDSIHNSIYVYLLYTIWCSYFKEISMEIRMRKLWNPIFESCVTKTEFPFQKNMNATPKIFLPHFPWFLSYPSNSPYIYLPTRYSLDTIYKVKYRVSQSKMWKVTLLWRGYRSGLLLI